MNNMDMHNNLYLAYRKVKFELYNDRSSLSTIKLLEHEKELEGFVQFQDQNIHSTQNYSYFPIILQDEEQRLKVQKALNEEQIFPRRYFYPSLDTLSYIEPKQYSPISRDISNRILALPMYPELTEAEQYLILNIVKENILIEKVI